MTTFMNPIEIDRVFSITSSNRAKQNNFLHIHILPQIRTVLKF